MHHFFSLFHLSSLCKLELSQAQPPLGSRRCRHASRSNEWGTIQLDPAYIELKLSTAANQKGKSWDVATNIRNVYARPCLTCVLRYSKSEYQNFEIWNDLQSLSSFSRFLRKLEQWLSPLHLELSWPLQPIISCKAKLWSTSEIYLLYDYMIANKSIKCQTPIKEPQSLKLILEPSCGIQTIFILVVSRSIVEPSGTWTPRLRISLLSRCPVPVQHAQVRRQWRPRFHHASKLAKIAHHCCYMPLLFCYSAFTPLTPCHHLSFFFVIASLQDYWK